MIINCSIDNNVDFLQRSWSRVAYENHKNKEFERQ
jgi:hypothetical protein